MGVDSLSLLLHVCHCRLHRRGSLSLRRGLAPAPSPHLWPPQVAIERVIVVLRPCLSRVVQGRIFGLEPDLVIEFIIKAGLEERIQIKGWWVQGWWVKEGLKVFRFVVIVVIVVVVVVVVVGILCMYIKAK